MDNFTFGQFAELQTYEDRMEFEAWLTGTIPGVEELARMAGMTLNIRRNSFGDATYVIRNENGFDFTTNDRDRAIRYMIGEDRGL